MLRVKHLARLGELSSAYRFFEVLKSFVMFHLSKSNCQWWPLLIIFTSVFSLSGSNYSPCRWQVFVICNHASVSAESKKRLCPASCAWRFSIFSNNCTKHSTGCIGTLLSGTESSSVSNANCKAKFEEVSLVYLSAQNHEDKKRYWVQKRHFWQF